MREGGREVCPGRILCGVGWEVWWGGGVADEIISSGGVRDVSDLAGGVFYWKNLQRFSLFLTYLPQGPTCLSLLVWAVLCWAFPSMPPGVIWESDTGQFVPGWYSVGWGEIFGEGEVAEEILSSLGEWVVSKLDGGGLWKICRDAPLLDRCCLEGPLAFLRWAVCFLACPFQIAFLEEFQRVGERLF